MKTEIIKQREPGKHNLNPSNIQQVFNLEIFIKEMFQLPFLSIYKGKMNKITILRL